MRTLDVQTPLLPEMALKLRAGDSVFLSGVLYVARDAAHQRFMDRFNQGLDLPVDLTNQVVFYAGPTPPKPGQVIGSIAPTTASRMDPYTPQLFRLGVRGAIGKGPRNQAVRDACQEYGCVCFSAIGGLSALLSQTVKRAEVVAYEDLGPEAVRRLEVERFPVTVVYDAKGNDLYTDEIAKYRTLRGR